MVYSHVVDEVQEGSAMSVMSSARDLRGFMVVHPFGGV